MTSSISTVVAGPCDLSHPAEQWEFWKATIYDLYVRKNEPLEAVQRKLEKESFHAR